MRAPRILLLLAALVLGLPLLAVGGTLLLVRLGAFDATLERTLSRTLATPVALDGFRVSLGKRPRIALEGLTVGAPGAALIEGADAAVTLPWRALAGDFSHQHAVVIDAGRLNLRVDAAGRDNWTALVERVLDLLGEGPAAFRVDVLEMKDLRLRYEDTPRRLRLDVAGFALTATGLVPREPFPVELRLAATFDPWSGHGRLAGKARLDPDHGRYAIDLDRFTIWAGGGSLPIAGIEATGRIEDLAYDLEADRADIRRAQGTFAGVAFEVRGTVARVTTDPAVELRLKSAPFAPGPFAEALGLELPATTDPKALARVQFEATVHASSAELAARDLVAEIDDTHATGSVTLPLTGGAAPRIVLHADRIDLDRYLPPGQAGKPAATGSEATLEASLATLRTLDVDADITIDEARAAGARLRGLRLRVEPDVRQAAP